MCERSVHTGWWSHWAVGHTHVLIWHIALYPVARIRGSRRLSALPPRDATRPPLPSRMFGTRFAPLPPVCFCCLPRSDGAPLRAVFFLCRDIEPSRHGFAVNRRALLGFFACLPPRDTPAPAGIVAVASVFVAAFVVHCLPALLHFIRSLRKLLTTSQLRS